MSQILLQSSRKWSTLYTNRSKLSNGILHSVRVIVSYEAFQSFSATGSLFRLFTLALMLLWLLVFAVLLRLGCWVRLTQRVAAWTVFMSSRRMLPVVAGPRLFTRFLLHFHGHFTLIVVRLKLVLVQNGFLPLGKSRPVLLLVIAMRGRRRTSVVFRHRDQQLFTGASKTSYWRVTGSGMMLLLWVWRAQVMMMTSSLMMFRWLGVNHSSHVSCQLFVGRYYLGRLGADLLYTGLGRRRLHDWWHDRRLTWFEAQSLISTFQHWPEHQATNRRCPCKPS